MLQEQERGERARGIAPFLAHPVRPAQLLRPGGNSLLVVRAAERLEAALGRRVPVLDLFRHGTVAALARHLSGADDPEAAPPTDEGRPSRLAAGKGRLHQLRRRKDTGG
jgi:hypothetical protein